MRSFIILSAVALIAMFCTNPVAALSYSDKMRQKQKKKQRSTTGSATTTGGRATANPRKTNGQGEAEKVKKTVLCDIVGKNECEEECGKQMTVKNGQTWTKNKAECVATCAACSLNKAKAQAKGKKTKTKSKAKATSKTTTSKKSSATSKTAKKSSKKPTAGRDGL